MPLPIVAIEPPDIAGVGEVDPESAVMASFVLPAMTATQKAKPDLWRGSPFAPLRTLKPIPKSNTVREMLAMWFAHNGVVATVKTIAGNATLILPDKQLAMVKVSTLWSEGFYRFQQIKDWDYQVALLLGISPQTIHLWIIPREEIVTRSIPQHGVGSRMLNVRPDKLPAWMSSYGGTLLQARTVLREAIGLAA